MRVLALLSLLTLFACGDDDRGTRDGGMRPDTGYRFDPATGATESLVNDTGRRIVGAGVSTCAPTELI